MVVLFTFINSFFSSSWATEEEKEERVRSLPRVKAMIEEAYNRLYSNWSRSSFSHQSMDEHYAKFEEDSFCPFETARPLAVFAFGSEKTVSHLRWYQKYINRCKVSELLIDAFGKNISSVPSERTQSPDEALEFSIWAPLSKFNMSLLRYSEYRQLDSMIVKHSP